MIRDRAGTLWAATQGGLARFEKDRWTRIGSERGCSCDRASSVYEDRDGTLWVSNGQTVLFLPRGAQRFQPTGDEAGGVAQFAESLAGTLWMAEMGRSVRPLRMSKTRVSSKLPEIEVGSVGILVDDDGSLWITSIGDGMRRVREPDALPGETIREFSPAAESFTVKDGLTSDYVTSILKDREGSIWVGTFAGLDRFRKGALIPVPLPSKFAGKAMIAGNEGDIWVGTPSAALGRIRENHFQIETHYSLFSGFRDPAGVIWMLAIDLSVFRLENGHFARFASGLPGFDVHLGEVLAKDGSGMLWLGAGPNLFYQKNGRWVRLDLPLEFAKQSAIAGYTDPSGHVWLGFTGNLIVMLDGTNAHSFTIGEGVQVGTVKTIQEGDRHLWIGGEHGLEVLEGKRFRPVLPADEETFRGVSGIVAPSDGSLWLSENRGPVHIPAGEISKALEQPSYRVHYELFDTHDGLPGEIQQVAPFPTAIPGTDGRVWFAASGGVAWIDSGHISKNPLPPPVSIRFLVANGHRYDSPATLRLHALTRNLEIDYTALSLAIPERVRFRYRLEGSGLEGSSDKDWQDAGTRRQAFYTNLGPGDYRFRVIACNNDGVWNEAGAVLRFAIAPAFYQTEWFDVVCALAVALSLAAAYQFRTRQIAAAMNVRFDDRLEERTRIARDFHDTLLQTLQGSKIVADDALKHRGDPSRMEHALERLSKWLTQATEEGRSALSSLRSSIEHGNDLAEAFRRAFQECRLEDSVEFRISVEGSARDMHPIVRDEVYRIGYEAIRNACLHSGASSLSVELDYRDGLSMRVRDNGKGMDPDLAATGKAGHFGLLGMYERAARIKGKLAISRNPENGTQVELVVPRSIVFQRSGRNFYGT